MGQMQGVVWCFCSDAPSRELILSLFLPAREAFYCLPCLINCLYTEVGLNGFGFICTHEHVDVFEEVGSMTANYIPNED
jgi:hypothetical protein